MTVFLNMNFIKIKVFKYIMYIFSTFIFNKYWYSTLEIVITNSNLKNRNGQKHIK